MRHCPAPVRMRAIIATALAAVALPAFADAPITAVPPADYRPPAVAKSSPAGGTSSPVVAMSAPTVLLLAPSAPAWRVALPEPTAAERATLQARNARSSMHGTTRGKPKGPLALAFPRALPAGSASVALDQLNWQALGDGSRAARIEIVSPTAAALRVALQMPMVDPGISLRFAGNGPHAQAFGPVPANAVASDTRRFGVFWSPVLEGDIATLELHADAGVRVPNVPLAIARVSHQVVAPASLDKVDAKAVLDIGKAGSCEIDVACVTPQSSAFADSRKAVAAIEFTQEDGFTYLCTGQLLNDSRSTNTPYFFSANHCLDSAMAARTLNTYWFFDAVECGSTATPPFVQQAAGATMLARSVDWDWSLVRLNAPPPAGAKFSAWRAEPMPTLATVSVLHHPEGDLKKFSQGASHGYQIYTDGSSFAQVQYSQGTTEPGSSGAGLLTFFSAGGYYEVRGGLWRGDASCDDPQGTDEFSRIENMLPLARQYLTPDSPGTPGQSVVVEYYDRALEHYFVTSSPVEINGLDTGVPGGWERTGLRFLAYAGPTPGANPVCRFYRTPGFGDSHFYSASASECQAVIDHPQTYPGWTYESGDVFYIALPDQVSGICANGTQPIWRFFNQRTTNHRYTSDHAVRDEMRADPATWVPEGYGPDSVVMCAPVGS
jgi:lysyl endopeptidase